MNREMKKRQGMTRRAKRTRSRIHGTAQKPRMSVFRSLRHISVQLIDDDAGVSIVSADDKKISGTKAERAIAVGKSIAASAKEKGIEVVVFDRGPYRYHGRVKALADAAREEGLTF